MNLELDGGTISIGQEGFPAYLIAFTLIITGPLAWFMPAQRHFYGLIAVFVAIYSLLGVNLGGFFAGMLLGVIGGGLIFAWSPITPPAAEPEDSSPSQTAGPEDSSPSQPAGPGDSLPRHTAEPEGSSPHQAPEPEGSSPRQPAGPGDSLPRQTAGPGDSSPRHAAGPDAEESSPRLAAMIIIALALSVSVMGTPGRAQAAPCWSERRRAKPFSDPEPRADRRTHRRHLRFLRPADR